MKLAEIKGKDSRELALDLQALRKEYFGMKFRAASEEVSNTARFREIRRTIARIQTVLGQRQRLATSTQAGATSPTAGVKSEGTDS